MDRVAVSKALSYLLRHNPDGLDMDQQGFAPVEQVLEHLRKHFPAIDQHRLRHLADDSTKQRFEIHGNRIRARYGHSIAVDIDWPTADDFDLLYHGTTEAAAATILERGLEPRGRQMVHLSATPEQARHVGQRHGSPVVLCIDVAAARRREVTFYRATDLVILAEYIPASVISRLG